MVLTTKDKYSFNFDNFLKLCTLVDKLQEVEKPKPDPVKPQPKKKVKSKDS